MKRRSFLKSVACCVAGAALSLGMMRTADPVNVEEPKFIPTQYMGETLIEYEQHGKFIVSWKIATKPVNPSLPILVRLV